MGLDEVTEALYALPRDGFTPARGEQVRAARAAGDRELAAAIGKLRRPTAAAWLLNQLVRADPGEPAALAELGEALRAAHAQLDGAALRELTGRRHRLVGGLVARAREIGRDAGQPVSDAVARELEEMVTAALADADAARVLASGRLTSSKDLAEAATLRWPAVAPDARPAPAAPRPAPASPGAGRPRPDGAGASPDRPATAAPGRAGPKKADRTPAGKDAGEPAAVERARAELERRSAALADAQVRIDAARDAMDTAAEEEAAAHRTVADLRAELTAAEQREQRARQEARAARRTHEDAERVLRDARRRHEVAAERLAALTGEDR